MTGDRLKRLVEEGEQSDRGTPDPWRKLGEVVPPVVKKMIGVEKRRQIESPKRPLPNESDDP